MEEGEKLGQLVLNLKLFCNEISCSIFLFFARSKPSTSKVKNKFLTKKHIFNYRILNFYDMSNLYVNFDLERHLYLVPKVS